MKILKTMKPHVLGSKRFLKRFGSRLIAVRQRLDEHESRVYTTVEIIMEERRFRSSRAHHKIDIDQLISTANQLPLSVGYDEKAMQTYIKQLGARWHPEDKVWLLDKVSVYQNGLTDRIVIPLVSKFNRTY